MNQWLESQNGAIGCVLIKPSLAPELVAECSEADFTDTCLALFTAIKGQISSGSSCDPITLNTITNGIHHDYIYQLLEITPSVENFRRYVEQTKNKAAMNRLQQQLLVAANSCSMDQMREALDTANEAMVTSRKVEPAKIGDLLQRFYTRKQTKEVYLTSGMPTLDRFLYINRGDFGFIGGYPSRGKTALALQLAAAQAREYRVGFFSLETNSDKITDRIIAQQSCVSMRRIKNADALTEKDWDDIGEAAAKVADLQLDIIEAAGMTVDDIFRISIAHRYEIIYVDYLQIIQTAHNSGSRYETVTDISIRLHTLAQRNKITVIALSQLSRNNDTATEEPNLSSLRESGQLEQDADFILFVYCEKKNETDGNRIVKIAKNKEGSTGKIRMWWNGDAQLMTPLASREPEPEPEPEPESVQQHFEKVAERSRKNKYIPMPDAAPDEGEQASL